MTVFLVYDNLYRGEKVIGVYETFDAAAASAKTEAGEYHTAIIDEWLTNEVEAKVVRAWRVRGGKVEQEVRK